MSHPTRWLGRVHHTGGAQDQTFQVKCEEENGQQVTRTVKRCQLPMTATYAFIDYCLQGKAIPSVLVDIATSPTGDC